LQEYKHGVKSSIRRFIIHHFNRSFHRLKLSPAFILGYPEASGPESYSFRRIAFNSISKRITFSHSGKSCFLLHSHGRLSVTRNALFAGRRIMVPRSSAGPKRYFSSRDYYVAPSRLMTYIPVS